MRPLVSPSSGGLSLHVVCAVFMARTRENSEFQSTAGPGVLEPAFHTRMCFYFFPFSSKA